MMNWDDAEDAVVFVLQQQPSWMASWMDGEDLIRLIEAADWLRGYVYQLFKGINDMEGYMETLRDQMKKSVTEWTPDDICALLTEAGRMFAENQDLSEQVCKLTARLKQYEHEIQPDDVRTALH